MNDPSNLAQRLDHALHQAAQPRAPRTLLPRVMAAVQASARVPWYRREWRRWPLGWQLASGVPTAALLGLALSAWSPSALAASLLEHAGAVDSAARMTRYVELAVTTTQVLWLVVGTRIVPALAAVAVLMAVECVLLGFTLTHVTLGRTGQR
jgi:hypothetical protein